MLKLRIAARFRPISRKAQGLISQIQAMPYRRGALRLLQSLEFEPIS
jgi:hypothetical protein